MVSRNLGAVLYFFMGGTLTLEFSIAELKDREIIWILFLTVLAFGCSTFFSMGKIEMALW